MIFLLKKYLSTSSEQPSKRLFLLTQRCIAQLEQLAFKNVNNCLNTNIYSYLETSGGNSCNLYFNVLQFFNTPVLIRHLCQLKTVVFRHRCLKCAVQLVKLSLVHKQQTPVEVVGHEKHGSLLHECIDYCKKFHNTGPY